MAGLKELRETMLSCTLKHPAVDLRGTSDHTKCRENHERGEGGNMAAHRQDADTHTQRTELSRTGALFMGK